MALACAPAFGGWLALSATPAMAATAGGDSDICSSRFLAYSSDRKVPTAERTAGRVRAEDRAFLDLAQQAFASGTYHERMDVERQVQGDSTSPHAWAFDEDVRMVQAVRKYYGVNELLHGGTYHDEGDNSTLNVWYCLPADQFATARTALRRERSADVERMRSRLGGLEQALTRDELDWAAGEMSALLGEVQARVMETETYTSPLTSEEKTFRGWLAQWRAEIQRGADYAMQILEEASRNVKEGHLAVAEGLLDDADKADPTNPRTRQLRLRIADLRTERKTLLKSAVDKAAVGKISAARADLARAEAIDVDDPRPVLVARREVESKRSQFLFHNPRVSGDVSMMFGGLGADLDGAADAYQSATGNGADPDLLVTLGLSVRVRLGRLGLFQGSGGYGFSDFRPEGGGSGGHHYVSYDEFLAGFGVRTIRTARRHTSFVGLAGFTREHQSFDLDVPGFDTSGTRSGEFVRAGVEWRRLSIFVQHGFGFGNGNDSGSSIVRWHDGTQFGLAFVF